MSIQPIMLNIERIIQEDPRKYCAPACIEMVLKSYGISRTQDEIWDGCRPLLKPQSSNVWYTDPEAVGAYINSVEQISSKFQVNDISSEDSKYAIGKIARNIVRYRHAPIILVWGGAHWVTVAGIQAVFSDDTYEKGEISGLWIADPGRGEIGIEFKPINEWFFSKYFTPSSVSNDEVWSNQFVIVGEASDDIIDHLEIKQTPEGVRSLFELNDITNLILDDIRFFGIGEGLPILGGGAVDPTPLKVQFIGSVDHYFITPVDINGRLAWTAFVLQESGNVINSLTGVIFADDLPLPPTGSELKQLLFQKLNIDNSSFIEKDGIFWSICRELPTMFNVVRIVVHNHKEYFITANGDVYDQLHFRPNDSFQAG